MTNEELLSVAEIVERLVTRLHEQAANHEAKMVEHRAAFGVRTTADAKIIAGLRGERNWLRAEVAELKTQLDRITSWATKNQAARETLQSEIDRLKSQTPKQHPVKVGEYVKRMTGFNTTLAGEIGRVTRVDDDAAEIEYEVKRPNGETGVWCAKNCEPCDPPEATHDTDTGKLAAESAAKTEPVADEIKVGDLVEVVSETECNTWMADVGSIGTVKSIETIDGSVSVRLDHVPGKKNALGGYVSLADVRKVTT